MSCSPTFVNLIKINIDQCISTFTAVLLQYFIWKFIYLYLHVLLKWKLFKREAVTSSPNLFNTPSILSIHFWNEKCVSCPFFPISFAGMTFSGFILNFINDMIKCIRYHHIKKKCMWDHPPFFLKCITLFVSASRTLKVTTVLMIIFKLTFIKIYTGKIINFQNR